MSATAARATNRNKAAIATMARSSPGHGTRESFSRPKDPEGGKHDPDSKFERVFRHPLERTMYDKAECDHDQAGRQRAEACGTKETSSCAQRQLR